MKKRNTKRHCKKQIATPLKTVRNEHSGVIPHCEHSEAIYSLNTGRSMLEMLGVLAIIGVLSVGGIAGFKMALNRHQENKVFDEANIQGLEILTARSVQMNGDEIYYPYASEFIVSRKIDTDRKNILLSTGILSESVCQSLSEKSNQGIFGEITCSTTNALTFEVPLKGKTYQTDSGNNGNIGGGNNSGDNTGGTTGGGSDNNENEGGETIDPCENKECNDCQKCENGSCVTNTLMNDLTCGENKYCSYGECKECEAPQETCVGSDATGSNGCQTHKNIQCTDNTYCDEGTDSCESCPEVKTCSAGQCCKSDGTDVCGKPKFTFGSDVTYKVNNANGCLVDAIGCSLDNPTDGTQDCGGNCTTDGDCVETCSTAINECVTACQKVNGVENKTYANNTTSCGTAGLCDGSGNCVECSGVENCATYTSENGKCECEVCVEGYMILGEKCIKEVSCPQLSCYNEEGEGWCCAEPETDEPISQPLACGENYGECTFNNLSCSLPNMFMSSAFGTKCCPSDSVAIYNGECVSSCPTINNCSTYDTSCNCTACADNYNLNASGTCDAAVNLDDVCGTTWQTCKSTCPTSCTVPSGTTPSEIAAMTSNGYSWTGYTCSAGSCSCKGYNNSSYYTVSLDNGMYAGAYPNACTACLCAGTQIALADGTCKNVEDIDYSDNLKVWDFDNGQFASANPLFIKIEQTADKYNLLKFDDGSELKTVHQHRIFNVQAGKFTYPMTEDTPIGTKTFNAAGKQVTLVSKQIVKEEVKYYNIITKQHLNCFGNGILTSCRLNNMYPIENMKFVKDDRKLLTYTNFPLVPKEWVDGLRLMEQPVDINRDGAVNFNDSSVQDYVLRLMDMDRRLTSIKKAV